MIDLILSFIYFLRPVSYVSLGSSFGGLRTLEWFAIISFALLIVIGFCSLSKRKAFRITALDLLIFIYSLWILAAFIAYYNRAQTADVGKFILPFLTYVIVRNTISNKEKYLRLLWLMIIGFSVPTIISAVLITINKGIFVQDYWTKLYRYTGVYPNPHDLGHNMTFLLMIIAVYMSLFSVHRKELVKISAWRKIFLIVIVAAALFCLYKSYVRTALLGLVVFMFVFLFFYSKKIMVSFGLTLAVAVISLWSVWAVIFHDVVEVAQGERETVRIASGRPYIWKHNFEEFKKLPFDRKMAGVGPGNRSHVLTERTHKDNFWNSHNDYLEVLIQTGIVGFILFTTIQILLLRSILRIPGRERYAYFALFVAVTFMNFASNSYISRYGLGQSLYLVIIYSEIAWSKRKGMGRWTHSLGQPELRVKL